MENTKTINVTFKEEELLPMYTLKLKNKWTWEELIKTTSKYYLEAQLEEEEEENA